MFIVRMQAALKKKFLEEQLPTSLTSLEALLKQNKSGDGFFVGDEVSEKKRLIILPFSNLVADFL